jgi:glucokinase
VVIAAFDIGGSHISCGYFDVATLRLLGEAEGTVPSIPIDDANSLRMLIELGEQAKALYGSSLHGLCLSIPGPFDYTRGVSQMRHKLVSWHGVDLRRLLSAASGVSDREIAFVNDADAFLLGALFMSSISTGRSVGITLGTGIGSAFAVGSAILSSGDGVPEGGEVWNLPYGRGMVEDAISTRRLEVDYVHRTGLRRSVKSIAEAAHAGEIEALAVFKDFGRELGEVLERIAGAFDPERILLGGGISAAEDLFLPSVLANRWCADRVSVITRRDAAPLAGAAVSWRVRQEAGFAAAAEVRDPVFAASTDCPCEISSTRR